MALKQDLNPPPGNLGQQFIERDSFALMRNAYAFVQGLYNRHNYVDLSWFAPGPMVLGLNVFRYPCPPDVEVRPTQMFLTVGTAPTGANLIIQVWRSGVAATAAKPAIPGGMMATATIFAGGNNAVMLYVDAQNFMVPSAEIFLIVTQIGSGAPGEDLHILVRG